MCEQRSGLVPGLLLPGLAASLLLSAPFAASAESYRINNVDRAARIHLREAPNGRSKVVAYILPSSKGLLGTGNCNEKWCEVTYLGSTGWVFRKYLALEPQSETAAAPAQPPADVAVGALPQPQPQPGDGAKEIPADLQDKMLRLANGGERDTPVYALPNDSAPVAGRVSAEIEEVEDLGVCTRKFCYIRSGSLTGWIREGAIAQGDAPAPPQAISTTVATANQAGALIDGLGSIEVKTYTLAGLSGDAALPLRDAPDDAGGILGWVPGNAKSVEGMRKCVQKWCLVRYEGLEGWIARRHLADEAEGARRYQVSGVALWGALDVVDYPGPDAAIVGHIPSYASGIVPIGACDKDWCHVRYLGVAGWVSAKFLALQTRR